RAPELQCAGAPPETGERKPRAVAWVGAARQARRWAERRLPEGLLMPSLLEASTAYCQRLARERAKNFFYGFLLLPKPRREAFCAVYSFMRYCDDVADGDASIASKSERLNAWRKALDRALQGDYSVGSQAADDNNLILPAFHHAVQKYSIPPRYF